MALRALSLLASFIINIVTLALSSFGGGNGAILLNNVECSGLEEQLGNCSHLGIGVHM